VKEKYASSQSWDGVIYVAKKYKLGLDIFMYLTNAAKKIIHLSIKTTWSMLGYFN
jgi:hypothetical protein